MKFFLITLGFLFLYGFLANVVMTRWRLQAHAACEFARLFVEALAKHRKRGNRHLPPLGLVKSWRMAQCGRAIILGPPYRLRWMEKANGPRE